MKLVNQLLKHKYKLSFSILQILILALPLTVSAGGQVSNTSISFIETTATGVCFIWLANSIVGSPPTCASKAPSRFVLDCTSPGGKAIMANMEIAFAIGKTVTIYGAGNCNFYSDTESISSAVSNQ